MRIARNLRALHFAFAAFALGTVVFSAPARAQTARVPIYNPKTETTFSGVVQEVKEVPGPGRSSGTHLVVKGKEATREVHVGPTWYLQQNGISFSKGEHIEVTGSQVKYEGSDVIIAREIKAGDKTITLRNDQGFPLWSRRGPRP
jgi:hypothetical protein